MMNISSPPDAVYRQERIYNLIPREEVQSKGRGKKEKLYRPVIHEKILTSPAMKTMGPAKVDVPSPDKYLKKHSKDSKPAENTKEGRIHILTKPPVPRRADYPAMGIQTKRDFVRTTAVVPRKPQPISVDTNKGHKQPLENSGLVPQYIKKKDYGEVPVYLQQRNAEQQQAQEAYENYLREQREQVAMKQLSDEERQTILERLKTNWGKLHQEYQSLSLVTDMLSKRANKERLEVAMKQLETDIDFFERFKTLYIPRK